MYPVLKMFTAAILAFITLKSDAQCNLKTTKTESALFIFTSREEFRVDNSLENGIASYMISTISKNYDNQIVYKLEVLYARSLNLSEVKPRVIVFKTSDGIVKKFQAESEKNEETGDNKIVAYSYKFVLTDEDLKFLTDQSFSQAFFYDNRNDSYVDIPKYFQNAISSQVSCVRNETSRIQQKELKAPTTITTKYLYSANYNSIKKSFTKNILKGENVEFNISIGDENASLTYLDAESRKRILVDFKLIHNNNFPNEMLFESEIGVYRYDPFSDSDEEITLVRIDVSENQNESTVLRIRNQ